MTRKYKLARLQKNILLGMSGVALASTMMLAGAQTTATSTATSTPTSTTSAIKNVNKAGKAEYNLCKKKALSERQKAKSDAEKKYFEAFKALKEKRLVGLRATRTATTSTSTNALVNKERQALRLTIEKQYQSDLRALKDIRHTERAKADESYDNTVCKQLENIIENIRGDENRGKSDDNRRDNDNRRDDDKRGRGNN